MSFVHLHNHSTFSLLDGLPSVEALAARAKELGMPAVALTDHGAMYGLVEFYQACEKEEIKPILGVEAYVAPNGLKNKRANIDTERYHLVLLAKNFEGYQNLIKMISIAHTDGFYYKPRIDLDLLREHSSGLFGLSACLAGQLARAAVSGGIDKARDVVDEYLSIFGDGNYFLEVQHRNNEPDQPVVNDIIFTLAKEKGLPVVATNDTHYLHPEDAEAQDILVCIGTKRKLAETDRLSMAGEDYSFKPGDEMAKLFPDHPEVITNTLTIAEQCEIEIPMGKIHFPDYDIPEGETYETALRKMVEEGCRKRYGDVIPDAVTERIEYELGVIEKQGFSSYFIICQDFINWSKEQGIVVGPGRGSAAGSLIAYVLNITNLDPLEYNLLFERFLNPERVSPPDIDTDFADSRREEVIKYVERKYGTDHVAQIITFGTMAARAAVRDVGRVLGFSYGFCDRIAKLIPMFTGLQEALDTVPELKDLYNTDPDAQRLVDAAIKLEGVCRHTSIHACGVVITDKPLTAYTPVQYAAADDDSLITQYSLHPAEDVGLLKMDFLGLKNLTIIETALDIIQATTGDQINIDDIPLDDPDTFELLKEARTTGVFQLESSGMKRYLRELKPTEIEDIIAMAALYRPGPLDAGMVTEYIERKHGTREITHLTPQMEPILRNTYGIIVYQEQVMEIARSLAGFTLGEADVLRKAVGKKIKELMDEQKAKLVDGMVKNHIEKKVANQIWEQIETFARYGFNRSHAACYAMIAYQTAYLKAKYPAQFMAALMTADYGNSDRIAIETSECEDMGMEVLAPDVNESFAAFGVVKESLGTDTPRIRFGLSAIKNVGSAIVDAIIQERKEHGTFASIEEVLRRVQHKDMNKKSLEAMIKTGAMDCLGERNMLLTNLENLLQFARTCQKDAEIGQENLFGGETTALPSLHLEKAEEAPLSQRLAWEKQLLGMYISDHPLKPYMPLLSEFSDPLSDLKQKKDQAEITVAGLVTNIHRIVTKKGKAMAFVTIEDASGDGELILFPKTYQTYRDSLLEETTLMVKGKVSTKDGEWKILADSVKMFSVDQLEQKAQVHLSLPAKMNKADFQKLEELMTSNPGNATVLVTLGDKEITAKSTVLPTEEFIEEVTQIIGKDRISLVYLEDKNSQS